jgi:TRAP-type C4-dicarboxylate transport system permease small subunit
MSKPFGSLSKSEATLLKRLENGTNWLAVKLNWVAAAAITAMMMLTCADVVMRMFRRPIPGTYEIVGFLGAVFAAFSLAFTSVERGHIAVDFLVKKFSKRTQRVIEGINAIICAALFALISWQSLLYAADLKEAGEVSMTLQMSIHHFVEGIAVGCALLTVVLLVRFAVCIQQLTQKEPRRGDEKGGE